ncbi:mucin-5AC-like [Dorcoceras hygrometricum]|uniref:Mucin-5AC-like n=1 Tax=Dorcoceras hygrometricum TaxID=472368 RepID=A0A2Z7AC34_9LAMI|nr:mucin-5AC-like [Dorcoceras hygrometricum]
MHRPDRCLQQFGMRQGIPPRPTNDDQLHQLTRQRRSNFDWAAFHRHFVDMWNNSYNLLIDGEYILPVPTTLIGYRPIDANYRNVMPIPSDSQHPSSARYPDEPGPLTTHFHTTTQIEGALGLTADSSFYTPQEPRVSQSLDHGFHTSFGGSFTQLLQSDFHAFTTHMCPSFNMSPIPYPDMATHDSGLSTRVVQDPLEGDDDHGRGRRVGLLDVLGVGLEDIGITISDVNDVLVHYYFFYYILTCLFRL